MKSPPLSQFFRLAGGLMWRPEPCYHSIGSGVLRIFTAQIFPTSDERTFLPQVLTVDGKCSIPAYIRFARFNSQIPALPRPVTLRLGAAIDTGTRYR